MNVMRLHAIQDFRLEEIEKPVPAGDQILVKIGACGICGSDIPRVYQLGTRVYPVVIGHEFSGTVVEVGNELDKELIGKKAAIFPLIPCRECEPCQIGEYCQCENYDYLGSRSNGGFAEYCLLPSKWHLVCSKDEEANLEHLALTEPACVALHALRKGKVQAGQSIVILGAGPIGILAARWAELFGVKQVILTDIDDGKKEFGETCGFRVINSKKQSLKDEIMKVTEGRGVDVVIEGTGCSAGINDAITITRIGGTIVWMGNPHADTQILLENHSLILRKELNMLGIWNSYYADTPINEWKYTVQMLDEKKLKVDDLITHKASLHNLKPLFEDIHEQRIRICKAMYSSALDE